jgi:hypothetical protein
MSATWTTLIVLALATAAIRATGPLALGGRDLPARVMRVISLLAAAVLAGLVAVETFAGADRSLEIDSRAAGLAAAAAVLSFRPEAMLPAVSAAAVVAAGARALV